MVPEPQDDRLCAAAFLVETRKRDEANRRVAAVAGSHQAAGTLGAAPDDNDAQLRAAAALVANRAQREITERVASHPRVESDNDRAR